MTDTEALGSDLREPLTFTYTNWRGETSVRRVIPDHFRFRSTEWHPEPQWLLVAADLDKHATRWFAVKDIQFSDGTALRAAEARIKALEAVLRSIAEDEDFGFEWAPAAARAALSPAPEEGKK